MKKVNKILILSLIMTSTMIILAGCGKTPKAPEEFDDDLWKDSVDIIRIIDKTYKLDNNFSVEDENAIEGYLETYKNRMYDKKEEVEMIVCIRNMYKSYESYIGSKRIFGKDGRMTIADREEFSLLFDGLLEKYKGLIK